MMFAQRTRQQHRKLMDLSADVWAMDKSGWSPIIHAAAQDDQQFRSMGIQQDMCVCACSFFLSFFLSFFRLCSFVRPCFVGVCV